MNYLNEKNNYLDNGFTILRNFIVKSDIDKLVTEVERVRGLTNLNKLRDLHLVDGRVSSMHNLADYSDYYKFFIQNSPIQDFFYSFLNLHFNFTLIDSTNSPGRKGVPSYLVIDSALTPSCLNKVDHCP